MYGTLTMMSLLRGKSYKSKGRIVEFQQTPQAPMLLFPFYAITPATFVPCPFGSEKEDVYES